MGSIDRERREMYRRAEELRVQLAAGSKGREIYYSTDRWTRHQELLSVYRELLVEDLDRALDKKVDVDLWNICFRDYINHLQNTSRDRRNKKEAEESKILLDWFLDLATGFYIVLLQQICRHTFDDLDLPFLRSGEIYELEHKKETDKKSSKPVKGCIYICQHCLVHLGDLSRYKNQMRQAESYYRQAIKIAPSASQAYNQLGLLSANNGDKLSSIYFYVRSLALKHPFPAAASNLTKMLSKLQESEKLELSESLINKETLPVYTLRFHASVHLARHLKSATKICHLTNKALTSIVATGNLDNWTLLRIITISLHLLNDSVENLGASAEISVDERKITDLLCESLAGMLNAFLLPAYTLQQGEQMLDYFALPATKLILDWILLNPAVLNESAFVKRMQIWPSLCKMLNHLSEIVQEEVDLKNLEDYPLPEDYDLQGFLPILPRLKRYNFKQILKSCHVAPSATTILKLRAQRLVDIGKEFASEEFKGKKLVKFTQYLEDSQKTLFEAIEQEVPKDLVREFDLMELSSSESENEDDKREEENVIEDNKMDQTTTQPRAPISRKNVAMATIMRQQGVISQSTSSENSRQLRFKSPSPIASQDSNMSQESGRDYSRLSDTMANRTFNHHVQRMPTPIRPAIRPNMTYNQHQPNFNRPSMGFGGPPPPPRPNYENHFNRPSVGFGHVNRPPRADFSVPPPQIPRPQDPWGARRPQNQAISGLGLNAFPRLDQDFRAPVLNQNRPVHNQGSYSLFSGPSFLSGPLQQGQQRQHDSFTGGTSALESLIRRKGNEEQ